MYEFSKINLLIYGGKKSMKADSSSSILGVVYLVIAGGIVRTLRVASFLDILDVQKTIQFACSPMF